MKLLSINEAAGQLGISTWTLYTWISQRKIQYVKIGRLSKFKQSFIDEYIEKNTVQVEERK